MNAASHNLPGVLAEIAEVAGLGAALKVAEAVGGTRAYVARRPGPENWLTRAVGPEAAARIGEHFSTGRGGCELTFPLGPAGSYVRERRQRAQRIAQLADRGLRSTEIARQAGLTRRGVQMHLAKRREVDEDQGGFDF